MAFSGTFKTLLNVHEERDAHKVVFSLIKSSFMKDFEGQWQVNCRTHMSYIRKMQQSCFLPCAHIWQPYDAVVCHEYLLQPHVAACAAVQHLTVFNVGMVECG